MSLLSGRLAVVTGGARGIGRAIAQVLSREGARVVVTDLDQEACGQAVKELGGSGDHFHVSMDVSNFKSVENASKEIIKRYGGSPADIVVNSAGITKDGYLLKMTEANFDQVINVNLKGTFNVNHVFAKAMKEHSVKYGSIVNIASIVGQTGNKGQTNYAASKAGVIAFTKSAAKELGTFNIRVNCICPGFIETPMTETIPEHLKQILMMQIPTGEFGKPEDIAEVAAFLASERSRYITGAEINVNGGLY